MQNSIQDQKTSFSSRFSNSLPLKVGMIAVIVLLLLIPKFMVMDLIRERKGRQNSVQKEVESKWGSPQTICGPYIIIPYNIKIGSKMVPKTLTILPENLEISSTVVPEKGRKRGIYEVDLYKSTHEINGHFILPNIQEVTNADEVFWDQTKVVTNISDLVGVQEKIVYTISDKKYTTSSGAVFNAISNNGVHCYFPIEPEKSDVKIPFKFTLKLNGSRSINYVPLGRSSSFNLDAKSGQPKYIGQFLPFAKESSDGGFKASWKVLDINRNFPQFWINKNNQVLFSACGVNFFPGVDEYVKNERSIKYAILFLSLTFLIFFLYEVMNNLKIHPIQYIIVGLALILFFVLLIALSEHISFALAYIIATISILSSIGMFIHSIFKNRKSTYSIIGLIGIIYGFIYVVLQLEDYALLAGSIGLFIVLFIVMLVARKINWYKE